MPNNPILINNEIKHILLKMVPDTVSRKKIQ